jgi:hypothetical protein
MVLASRLERVVLAALTLAMVASVAVLAGLAPAAAAAVVLSALAAAIFTAGAYARAAVALLVLVTAPAVGGYADTREEAAVALRYCDDSVLAVGVLLLLANLNVLPLRARQFGSLAVAVLVLSELGGALQSNSDAATVLSAAWQDLRWIGVFGWGVWVAATVSFETRVRWAYRLSVGWAGLTAIVAVVQVGIGAEVETRLSIPTGAGLFSHPVPASLAAVMAISFALTDKLSPTPVLTQAQRTLAYVVGIAAVATTLRFQVLIVLAAVALVIVLRRQGLGPLATGAAIALIPIVITASLLGLSAATSGFGDIGPPDSPSSAVLRDVSTHAPSRVRLADGAMHLASESFPFGWGLGTYGSGLEPRYESAAFQEVGLLGLYGFRDEGPNYRADNFVAHVLAERGYIGLALWVVGLTLLVAFALVASPKHLLPAAAVAGGIATTPFGPAFKSAPYMMILLLAGALLLLPRPERRPPPEGQ